MIFSALSSGLPRRFAPRNDLLLAAVGFKSDNRRIAVPKPCLNPSILLIMLLRAAGFQETVDIHLKDAPSAVYVYIAPAVAVIATTPAAPAALSIYSREYSMALNSARPYTTASPGSHSVLILISLFSFFFSIRPSNKHRAAVLKAAARSCIIEPLRLAAQRLLNRR